jgi:hypothetical protein
MGRRREVACVHQAQGRADVEDPVIERTAQGLEDLGRVSESARLDEDAVRALFADQAVEADGEQRRGDAAQAPAGDLLDRDLAVVEQGTVDADVAELVDEYGPAFPGRVSAEQVADRRGLSDAEEPGDQVDRDACAQGVSPVAGASVVSGSSLK